MHGLAVYMKEGLPFARDFCRENSVDSYLRFRLALLHSVSYFFFLYGSPSLLCTIFDSISSNIDVVLSINPSANVMVFGDLNVHHKYWLTYSGGADRAGELCLSNFSISNDLTQIANFPTRIADCDSHSPALLDLFLSSDASICSISLHWEILIVSVFIEFPVNSKQDALFYCTAYDYSRADWDGLHDHLRDVPWEDIFKLSASAAASEFCE